MTTYAVTGATGRFGRVAIETLVKLTSAAQVVALARNPAKAEALLPAGVTIRPGDYDQPAALAAALAGVDRLLMVSSLPGGPVPRQQQHQNVVSAAQAAGVSFIAYTSFPHADVATAPLAADHQATEAMITASGLPHAFLRNNWYLENETALLKAAAAGQPFIYATGAAKVGWALEREYAEAAAIVLTTAAPQAVYEFSGPGYSFPELAAAMPEPPVLQPLSDTAFAAALKARGVGPGGIAYQTQLQGWIRAGDLAGVTQDLPTVLGRPLTPLPTAVAGLLGAQ